MIWTPHVTVAAIVQQDGRFLMVQEAVENGIVLNQPAGHLEEDDTLLQAVVRETLEESAWHFRPEALLGIYRWLSPRNQVTYLRFAFTGSLLQHEPERPLDHGILDTVWMTPDAIRQSTGSHRSPQVLQCVDDYLSGVRYPLTSLHDLV
jgi:8-oxo-dGTP pyrophosphatase MutT (NUDIX family)